MNSRREVLGLMAATSAAFFVRRTNARPIARLWTDTRDDAAAESLGFRLGTQAWTFRDRTLFEALDYAKKLGLRYVEMFPGQSLSPDERGAKVGPELSKEQIGRLKEKLAATGISARAFGVWNFSKDEAAGRRIFEFAKEMGIETVTCEPAIEAWDLVEKLANEYKIDAACHNHPKPTTYWDPAIVMNAVGKRGQRVGACADIGHWTRSGVDAPEGLKKYEGKLKSLHFKDIKEGIDQPWGTGLTGIVAVLRELRRQKFKGLLSMEYEHGSGAELEANTAKCVAFFDQACRELLEAEKKAAPGDAPTKAGA